LQTKLSQKPTSGINELQKLERRKIMQFEGMHTVLRYRDHWCIKRQ